MGSRGASDGSEASEAKEQGNDNHFDGYRYAGSYLSEIAKEKKELEDKDADFKNSKDSHQK